MISLAGTTVLVRLALRHDRVRLSVWILGMCVTLAAITGGLVGGLTQADLVQQTEFNAGSPALRMFGLASGATPGGYTLLRSYLTLAILAALMSAITVVRHTRGDEETGRAELVGAAVVGRHASIAAALAVTAGANVVLAALLALALIINGQSAAGSLTAGVSVGAVGMVFAAGASITAQLASSARAATGLAGAVLGLAFLLSGIGNMLGDVDASGLWATSAWPAWLSPIGWGEHMRPYGGDQWWPLIPFAVLFVVLVGAAGVLASHRDFGRGMLRERPGRGRARPGLLTPLGLTVRLQLGTLLGWMGAMLAFGVVFGLISSQVSDLEGGALDWYTRFGGTEQIEAAYLISMIKLAGIAVAIYVVQMLVRMPAEESDGQLEPLLAAAVSRRRWALGHVVNAGLGAVALLVVFAAGLGLAAGAMLGDTSEQLRVVVTAGVVQLPAILVLGAVVIAATGLLPRWAGAIAWAVLVVSILLGPLFGAEIQLPHWAQDLSPFTHVPNAPATAVAATPVVALLALSAALATAGLISFGRRDLVLPT